MDSLTNYSFFFYNFTNKLIWNLLQNIASTLTGVTENVRVEDIKINEQHNVGVQTLAGLPNNSPNYQVWFQI